MSPDSIAAIAAEALAAIDAGRSIASFSARHPHFTLDDAYRVTAAMRRARLKRGERMVGRKIGFTNRTIWAEYNVFAPMWGYAYDTTVYDITNLGGAFPLERLAEPRIEPEIVFGIRRTPKPGMDDALCSAPSNGWRTASRSCNRSFRIGNSPPPTPSPPTACTAR